MQHDGNGQRELEERAQEAALRARIEGFVHTAEALEAVLVELCWAREKYGLQICNTRPMEEAAVAEESIALIGR